MCVLALSPPIPPHSRTEASHCTAKSFLVISNMLRLMGILASCPLVSKVSWSLESVVQMGHAHSASLSCIYSEEVEGQLWDFFPHCCTLRIGTNRTLGKEDPSTSSVDAVPHTPYTVFASIQLLC